MEPVYVSFELFFVFFFSGTLLSVLKNLGPLPQTTKMIKKNLKKGGGG